MFTPKECSRQKYCLLQLEYWTLERITICRVRSYEDQHWESLKQENPKSTKHEKRHRHAPPSTATGLEVYKQTWCCFLATQEMQIPLGTSQGLSKQQVYIGLISQAQVQSGVHTTLLRLYQPTLVCAVEIKPKTLPCSRPSSTDWLWVLLSR